MTPTAAWAGDELARIHGADELQISSRRPDGSERPFVTIWAVRSGDTLYIRSAYGGANGWYRRALRSGAGRIRAGGVDRAVTFAAVDAADEATQLGVDAAYHRKYDRYGARIVNSVVGATAHQATLRVDPR